MENLELYDELVSLAGLERKGKSMPYTSANGHMFSQLNKSGEIGIRLSKQDQKKFVESYDSGPFKSYGAVMKDYVLVPKSLLSDLPKLSEYLKAGEEYVKSLPPK